MDIDTDTAAGRLVRMAWSCAELNQPLARDVREVLLERDNALKRVADLEAQLIDANLTHEQLDLGLRERARLVAVRGLEVVTDGWTELRRAS